MNIITISAYAKINLGLRILCSRPDGYHNIITCFQRVSLRDTLLLYPTAGGVTYNGPRITESPEANLSVKAAQRFFELYPERGGVEITLKKVIPTGAGLGGGSSDAAAVLRGLASMHRIDLSQGGLDQLAIELGADVTFFLHDIPSAIGRNLGETLTPVESLASNIWILLYWPGFQISTAQAYRDVDNSLTLKDGNTNFEAWSLSTTSVEGKSTYINDFETVVFSSHPQLLDMRNQLLEKGAFCAGLSGSGSSLFALFDGEAIARAALADMQPPGRSFLCRPC
jgi:4-diphosphocytidyl-2-C-methyl-D-erythritol kinase